MHTMEALKETHRLQRPATEQRNRRLQEAHRARDINLETSETTETQRPSSVKLNILQDHRPQLAKRPPWPHRRKKPRSFQSFFPTSFLHDEHYQEFCNSDWSPFYLEPHVDKLIITLNLKPNLIPLSLTTCIADVHAAADSLATCLDLGGRHSRMGMACLKAREGKSLCNAVGVRVESKR